MQEDQINNLQQALKLSPENQLLRLMLAEAFFNAKQFDLAESEFKKILAQDPANLQARTGLAKVFFELQKYSTAIIVLEELLTEQPNNVFLTLLLCRSLLRNSEIDKAIQQYQNFLRVNPSAQDSELDQHLRKSSPASEGIGSVLDAIESGFQKLEKPTISFDHVGGMEKVKEEIKIKIIQPLQYPEYYKAYGKKIGGGILLYGPPGCGKTYLARATAGQINASFISIGIHDVLDMWVGSSEKKLHELFELARRQSPCVLFFDEIDALGASRADMRHSASKMLINQFLTELDGVQASNDGLLVLGATNAPWHLDSAFRRPGRFDRIIFVQPPDAAGRESILKILLQDKPCRAIDYTLLARQTQDFSGADLKAIVDTAIEEKLRESFEKGKPQPIENKDLVNALKKVRPSTKEWFTTARNYALYANDSGLYDDILDYLKIKK